VAQQLGDLDPGQGVVVQAPLDGVQQVGVAKGGELDLKEKGRGLEVGGVKSISSFGLPAFPMSWAPPFVSRHPHPVTYTLSSIDFLGSKTMELEV
jgi:hypothetical protein